MADTSLRLKKKLLLYSLHSKAWFSLAMDAQAQA